MGHGWGVGMDAARWGTDGWGMAGAWGRMGQDGAQMAHGWGMDGARMGHGWGTRNVWDRGWMGQGRALQGHGAQCLLGSPNCLPIPGSRGSPVSTGGTRGDTQGGRSTHGKAGGTRRTGVARLPGRSLCRRRRMLSQSAVPQPGAQSPWGTSVPPIPSSHTTHRLPFGSSKPGRATFPLETLRREKRGAAGALPQPCPGLCPAGSTAGQSTGAADPGTAHGVHGPHQPMLAPGCPAPPGTGEDPLDTRLGSLHPCQPGTLTARHRDTAACAPHTVARRQDPRAASVARGRGELSPGGPVWPAPGTPATAQVTLQTMAPAWCHPLPAHPPRARQAWGTRVTAGSPWAPHDGVAGAG